MAFSLAKTRIHFHKSYLQRVPKRTMPCYSGTARFGDIDVSLVVKRNLQGTKFFWIFVILGRTFVFWSEVFDSDSLREFNIVCSSYVSAFIEEVNKNSHLCNVLTQKSFV